VIKKAIERGDFVLSCDWKSFDGSEGWLAVDERDEFYIWVQETFGDDPALLEVLRTQTRCTVIGGPLTGKIFGNRGSGTAGTSTGNKLVVLAALFYSLGPALRGRNACKLYCDGDDTLIIVPRQFQGLNPETGRPWYLSWVRRLEQLGLETKVEQKLPDSMDTPASEAVRFCRAGVISTSRGWLLCKNPVDAMKVMTNFRRHFTGSQFKDYLQTLSVGLRDVYGDVPVLCGLWRLFDVGGRVDKELFDVSGMEYMIARNKSGGPGLITEEHRWSFFHTWGLSPTDQRRAEAALTDYLPHFREDLQDYLSTSAKT
jgi:hypothetical protein